MNISEMHTTFRVLSQQMGLHLVRNILPESIDIFINAEIQDLVNRELMQNAIVETQNNSNYDSISVSSINTFKTLHCKYTVELSDFKLIRGKFEIEITNFNPLFILKASLNDDADYKVPCRIINPDLIEQTIKDYCSSPDINNPIVSFYNANSKYVTGIYCNDEDANFKSMIIDYIKQPNKVSLKNSTDCNLPEHLHYIIVENAVKRFYGAIGSSVSNNQNINNK